MDEPWSVHSVLHNSTYVIQGSLIVYGVTSTFEGFCIGKVYLNLKFSVESAKINYSREC